MKYSINLFGSNFDCELKIDSDKLFIEISAENKKALKAYLKRVLLKYGHAINGDSLEEIVQKAIDIERYLGGKMSEPTVKLPYEFAPETKEKLVESAKLQGISATQLLIKLIEMKYQEIMIEVK